MLRTERQRARGQLIESVGPPLPGVADVELAIHGFYDHLPVAEDAQGMRTAVQRLAHCRRKPFGGHESEQRRAGVQQITFQRRSPSNSCSVTGSSQPASSL